MPESGHVFRIEGDSIVLNMPPQLAAEPPPDLFQLESVPYLPSPSAHFCQFGSETLSAGFHLRDDFAFAGLPQIEREP